MKSTNRILQFSTIWLLLLTPPLAVALFFLVFRTAFAGPELAFFEGFNIAAAFLLLHNLGPYRKKYEEKVISKMKRLLLGYTIAQSLICLYAMTIYNTKHFITVELILMAIFLYLEKETMDTPQKAK